MAEFSYLHTPNPTPLKYKTIPDMFLEQVKMDPGREIFVHRHLDGKREALTRKELYDKGAKVAKYLVQKGIKRGDRIVILGPNCMEWIIGELGIIMAGGIAVHVAVVTVNATEVRECCEVSKAKGIFLSVGNTEIYSLIDHDAADHGRFVVNFNTPEFQDYSITAILSGPDIEATLPRIYPEDDAVVLTTSGSTGKPKMVVHNHLNLANLYEILNPTNIPTIIYNDRPFCWIGGCPICSLPKCDTRVFMNSEVAADCTNIHKIWQVIKEEGCTIAGLMPYMLKDLIDSAEEVKKSNYKIKSILTGGQIVEHATKLIGEFCEHLTIAYGLTELIVISYWELQGKGEFERGNVGVPRMGVEVRIVDEEDLPVNRNCLGSIQARSNVRFKRYLDNEDLSKLTITDDGWVRTGDVGKITSDGSLVIKGREKDIISRGTRKIIPTFIEEILEEMPEVKGVVVIAVPDSRLGEEICACFIPHDYETLSDCDVKKFCEIRFVTDEAIDGFGCMPKYYLKCRDFPRLENGKIDKISLKKQATESMT